MSNFHLQEIETLQNSLREREEYVTELENRLRALWDKYDGDRKHYMERIKRLEEENNELRAEEARLLNTNGELKRRIKRLGEAGERMRLYCADPDDCFAWDKAKEAKL